MALGENGEGGSDLETTWWSGEESDAKGEDGDEGRFVMHHAKSR